MDKKLVAAFTFGLLAVSAANLLLSVGIVSLLLTGGPGTDVQLTDTGGTWMTARNALSLTGMNNTTMETNASKVDMPLVNATITPAPSTGQQLPTGLPSGGQFPPASGQLPPTGQFSQGAAGQMPPSGQLPSTAGQTSAAGQNQAGAGQTPQAVQASSGTGQALSGAQLPSGTSQLPSGMGQYLSGSGPMPGNGMSSAMGTGALPVDINNLINGQTLTASPATATPKPTLSFFNNMTSMLANQQPGT
jgi:hypothetical protein